MSDSASHDAASETHEVPVFSPVEVEQFSADDVTAGGAIGKMLSALFLYTILSMGIAGWWTYSSIIADDAYETGSGEAGSAEVHATEKAAH